MARILGGARRSQDWVYSPRGSPKLQRATRGPRDLGRHRLVQKSKADDVACRGREHRLRMCGQTVDPQGSAELDLSATAVPHVETRIGRKGTRDGHVAVGGASSGD